MNNEEFFIRDADAKTNDAFFKIGGIRRVDFLKLDEDGNPPMADDYFMKNYAPIVLDEVRRWGEKAISSRDNNIVLGRPLPNGMFIYNVKIKDGLRNFSKVNMIIADSNMNFVAAMDKGTVLVDQKFRGQGIGRHLVMESYRLGREDDGFFFSPEGYRARQSLHRLALTASILRGVVPCSTAIIDYGAFDGDSKFWSLYERTRQLIPGPTPDDCLAHANEELLTVGAPETAEGLGVEPDSSEMAELSI